MIGEMIIWGFFAAFGSMGAYKIVEHFDGSKNNKTIERNEGSVQAKVQRSDKAECKGSENPVQEVAR